MEEVLRAKIDGSSELKDLKKAHELQKTKVKILESELEKALQRNRS